jgi:hypothetical protein
MDDMCLHAIMQKALVSSFIPSFLSLFVWTAKSVNVCPPHVRYDTAIRATLARSIESYGRYTGNLLS